MYFYGAPQDKSTSKVFCWHLCHPVCLQLIQIILASQRSPYFVVNVLVRCVILRLSPVISSIDIFFHGLLALVSMSQEILHFSPSVNNLPGDGSLGTGPDVLASRLQWMFVLCIRRFAAYAHLFILVVLTGMPKARTIKIARTAAYKETKRDMIATVHEIDTRQIEGEAPDVNRKNMTDRRLKRARSSRCWYFYLIPLPTPSRKTTDSHSVTTSYNTCITFESKFLTD